MATIGIIIKYIFVRIIVGILCVGLFVVLLWLIAMYKAFDYRGKRQMSRQIIEGIAEYVKVPAGGSCRLWKWCINNCLCKEKSRCGDYWD